MNKKILIYFLFCFLLINIVYSVPPVTQVSQTINTLAIAYPKAEILKINGVFDTHWHVYNSTGYSVSNATTDCFFHLYDVDGQHILQNKSKFSSNGIDFEFPINTSPLHNGLYPYIIQCNNTKEAGFVSGTLEMSHDGKATNPLNMLSILIGVFFIALILMIFAFLISDEHQILKFILYLSALFITTFIPLAIVQIYEVTNSSNLYVAYTWILRVIMIYLFIYYFVYKLMLKWGWFKNGK